jgi:hypothetical protein
VLRVLPIPPREPGADNLLVQVAAIRQNDLGGGTAVLVAMVLKNHLQLHYCQQ